MKTEDEQKNKIINFMKKLVSLKLSKQTVPVKIENTRHYVTAMTGNPNFTTPSPSLASITTAVNALETAYNNALGGGKVLTALMHDKELILDTLLTQLSHYVEAIANGSETIILSAGMEMRTTSIRAARAFSITTGNLPGEIKLVTKYKNSNAYIWQLIADPLPDDAIVVDPTHIWTQAGVSTKATFNVADLTIGKKYWFRFAYVNKSGQDAWSDPLSKMVI